MKFLVVLISTIVLVSAYPKLVEEELPPLPEGGLIEGDMAGLVYTPGRGVAIRPDTTTRPWPNGVVPYNIESHFTGNQLNNIMNAMRTIEDQTRVPGRGDCVKFVPRSNEPNGIRIFSGQGCYSYVMMISIWTSQDLSLQANGCTSVGTAIHEMLHALGFFHEQSRPDRDQFVRIFPENINPSTLYNFDKYTEAQVNMHDTNYDIGSIMHYENTAFTINGRHTIEALDGTPLLHASFKFSMSPIDVEEVRIQYNCYNK